MQKNWNINEWVIDSWPYFIFEENISIINEINKDEEEQSSNKGEDLEQNIPKVPNLPNPSSYMDKFNSISNQFKF